TREFNAFCGRGAHNRPELVRDRDELGAWAWSVLGVVSRLAQRLPAVGQQLLDPTRRMCADPVEHVAKVRLRVDPQVLARRAQAHQDGRRLTPLVAPPAARAVRRRTPRTPRSRISPWPLAPRRRAIRSTPAPGAPAAGRWSGPRRTCAARASCTRPR